MLSVSAILHVITHFIVTSKRNQDRAAQRGGLEAVKERENLAELGRGELAR